MTDAEEVVLPAGRITRGVVRVGLPDAIIERLNRNVRFWTNQIECPGDILTAPEKLPEFVAWSKREQQFVEAHVSNLVTALR